MGGRGQWVGNSYRYGDINPAISIIYLNVNGVNTAIKTQILRKDLTEKQHPTICFQQETHKDRLKVKE